MDNSNQNPNDPLSPTPANMAPVPQSTSGDDFGSYSSNAPANPLPAMTPEPMPQVPGSAPVDMATPAAPAWSTPSAISPNTENVTPGWSTDPSSLPATPPVAPQPNLSQAPIATGYTATDTPPWQMPSSLNTPDVDPMAAIGATPAPISPMPDLTPMPMPVSPMPEPPQGGPVGEPEPSAVPTWNPPTSTPVEPPIQPSIPPFDPSVLGVPPVANAEPAPTDLSQLNPSPVPAPLPVENYAPAAPDNLVVPQAAPSTPSAQPETVHTQGKFPLGLLVGGVITLVVILAASVYFFFFAGSPNSAAAPEPANKETQIPANPPEQLVPPSAEPAIATASAEGSGGFGQVSAPSPTAEPSAQSALDRIKQREIQ